MAVVGVAALAAEAAANLMKQTPSDRTSSRMSSLGTVCPIFCIVIVS